MLPGANTRLAVVALSGIAVKTGFESVRLPRVPRASETSVPVAVATVTTPGMVRKLPVLGVATATDSVRAPPASVLVVMLRLARSVRPAAVSVMSVPATVTVDPTSETVRPAPAVSPGTFSPTVPVTTRPFSAPAEVTATVAAPLVIVTSPPASERLAPETVTEVPVPLRTTLTSPVKVWP